VGLVSVATLADVRQRIPGSKHKCFNIPPDVTTDGSMHVMLNLVVYFQIFVYKIRNLCDLKEKKRWLHSKADYVCSSIVALEGFKQT
jgi:hypothetical protein